MRREVAEGWWLTHGDGYRPMLDGPDVSTVVIDGVVLEVVGIARVPLKALRELMKAQAEWESESHANES